MRKRTYIYIIFCFLCSNEIVAQSTLDVDNHVLKLDWNYTQEVPIYEHPDSARIIEKVRHLYEEESPVGFLVQDSMSTNGWLKVQVYWEDRVMDEIITGYIHLEEYIVITPMVYQQTQVFEEPSLKSPSRIIDTGKFSLSVKNYFKGWVFVSLYDANNKLIEGWIAPFSQCPLMFTTCC